VCPAGDIGTSPLYVYSTIFETQPSHEDVLCATSLIFWSITLVVLLKYVFIVLLADDNGEGGTFALYAQICRACGINQTNQADMAADKQLYEQAGSSAAATPSSSTRQLKVGPAQQQHPQGAPGAAAAQEQQDGHADSHTGPQKVCAQGCRGSEPP
jgi:KUP system potassium uptake protein